VSPDDRHLICSIGTGSRHATWDARSANPPSGYQAVIYQLGGREDRPTRFAPAALARLLSLGGAKASVLATAKAYEGPDYEALALELREAGLHPAHVPMPEGRTEDEILDIFNRLVDRVQPGEKLVLDVTLSLRHLPFVYLAALAYLTAYYNVEIQGIYYGAFDLRTSAPDTPAEPKAPILEITSLFRLIQWYHAAQTAREGGDLRVISRLLGRDVPTLARPKSAGAALREARKHFAPLASALAVSPATVLLPPQ